MCFFNNCGCQRSCCCGCGGSQGPVGPRGPVGPQGPAGVMRLAAFTNASVALDEGEDMPLTDVLNVTSGAVTHAALSSDVVLSAGSYLITYSSTVTSATTGTVSLGLQVNDTTVATASETIATANSLANVAGQYVLTVPTGTTATINLTNEGANAATYTGAELVVQPI